MITGEVKQSEKQYRAIPVDSSSTLKLFATSKKEYYKQVILGEKPMEEDESRALLIGSMVHCLLLEEEEFNNRYFVSTCENKPTEKMMDFVNSLYKFTMLSLDENGKTTKEFEEIAREAYAESPVGRHKFETQMENFNSGPNQFFAEVLATRPKGIPVVSQFDYQIAQNIANTLIGDEFVSDIINAMDNDDLLVINEFKLEGDEYKISGLPLKGMLDKVIIDNKNKTITPYDIKIVWDTENFYEGYYLKRKAYLQAFIYWQLLGIWAENNGFSDYDVKYIRFIVADSSNFYKPLIFKLDNQDMTDALTGFTHKGRDYEGFETIVRDLKWALDNNQWQISKENFDKRGIVSLKSAN